MMLGKRKPCQPSFPNPSAERVTSVIGPGIIWTGDLRGKGGVRIEGTVDGDIAVQGLVVVGESGKVNCQTLQAERLIVAGTVKGNLICGKLEIRATGRIWGDVVTTSFSSEDGAFLRGQMRMEDKIEISGTGPDPRAEALENQPMEIPSEEE